MAIEATKAVTPSMNITQFEDAIVDMWYRDELVPQRWSADCYFYPEGNLTEESCYSGNIFDDDGRAIGDYTSYDFEWIWRMFREHVRPSRPQAR